MRPCVATAVLLGGILLMGGGCGRNDSGPPELAPPPASPADSRALPGRVKLFCGNCHEEPPADISPRAVWKNQVERMYMFFNESRRPLQPPPIEQVVRYYEERAPDELPHADIKGTERYGAAPDQGIFIIHLARHLAE